MKNKLIAAAPLLIALLFAACTETLDPLSPGSVDGEYALGIKSLVPLAVGNTWTYAATVFDTNGVQRSTYTYSMTIKDTVTADTGKIPLLGTQKDRRGLTRGALLWYLLSGESGSSMCWQVDSLENLRMRKSDDSRFYEQTAFNFRAQLGDVMPSRYVGRDTVVWASGDRFVFAADSVRSTLVSKGVDTLRTTLGSAVYLQYREYYVSRTDFTNYYFKPGFGLLMIERFQRTPGGRSVCVRRDQLVSYYFQ